VATSTGSSRLTSRSALSLNLRTQDCGLARRSAISPIAPRQVAEELRAQIA
jgi:hypothetical protein